MTGRSQSVQVETFELVLAAPGIALLRVRAARSRRRQSASRPHLVVQHEQGTHRFAPLPAPDDPRGVLRAAYSVPVELLEHEVTFALEFQNGSPFALPQPTEGSMRLPSRGGEQVARPSSTAEADLDDDRRTDLHEKLVQQSQALAESERSATARDRSQRNALAKLRAELEQHQQEGQRAWTRVDELEHQAADIVARIDASAAELEQARQALSAADQRARVAAEQAASLQVRAESAERRIPELEAAAQEHARRNAELEQRHQQMERELASAESERARIDEKLGHVSEALRLMTVERDELTRQVSAHDSVAVKARERAYEAEKAHAEASAALGELESWREELERRLTELTSELAATKQAFEEAESERRRLAGALGESDARAELAEARSASRGANVAELTAQLSERESELAEALRAADESRTELQAAVSSLEEAVARGQDERAEQDRGHAADAAELDALRAAQAQAQATLATLQSELEEARLHADRSGDLEREVEASRGDADRLQAAVVRLESEIRSTGQGKSESLRDGSDRELAAVSNALDGAREEMNALRQELEAAQASERRANLELVMLTAETQARLQARTELGQAAREPD